MKRLLGIIGLGCLCMLLGMSIKWGITEKITLVSAAVKLYVCPYML